MITFVEGVLEKVLPTMIVINANGIGYQILIPLSSFDRMPQVGSTLRIATHHHVREDAQLLYGFYSEAERDLFRLLLAHVSGVGPKLALAILSGMSLDQFKTAVISSDIVAISKISGVGKKTAERVVLELKDKLGVAAQWEAASLQQARGGKEKYLHDAILALISLGYKQVDAEREARKVLVTLGEATSTEEIVRETLKRLVS
jgi:Holliday junction DNA helicase RuvA